MFLHTVKAAAIVISGSRLGLRVETSGEKISHVGRSSAEQWRGGAEIAHSASRSSDHLRFVRVSCRRRAPLADKSGVVRFSHAAVCGINRHVIAMLVRRLASSIRNGVYHGQVTLPWALFCEDERQDRTWVCVRITGRRARHAVPMAVFLPPGCCEGRTGRHDDQRVSMRRMYWSISILPR